MNFFIQIIVSGLTFGAMYALAAVGLALVWGAFNMLNMAHGIIMTLGAYFVLVWAEGWGLPLWFAGPFAFIAGGVFGADLLARALQRVYRKRVRAGCRRCRSLDHDGDAREAPQYRPVRVHGDAML